MGDNFTGFYLLRNIMMRPPRPASPTWRPPWPTATGSVDAKAWDYPGPISPADEGKVVKVQGVMQEFRGMPQITMEKVRLAQPEEYDSILEDLVPSAPINRDEAFARVEALVDSMADGTSRRCAGRFSAAMAPSSGGIPRPRPCTTASWAAS